MDRSEEQKLLGARRPKLYSGEPSGETGRRDMLTGSWFFLLGSVIFTVCVSFELAVDSRSLPFWMLTMSGLLFCAGSACFVRAFSKDEKVSKEKGSKRRQQNPFYDSDSDSDDEVTCSRCARRHLATDILAASWCFLVACVPVVVASAYYVAHQDDRLYFWGSLAGSLAFCAASAFFVVASYPNRERYEELPKLVASVMGETEAQKHCASEWILANWAFLLLTFLWLFSSAYAFSTQPQNRHYQFSLLEAIIYVLASLYFLRGSYAAQQDHSSTPPPKTRNKKSLLEEEEDEKEQQQRRRPQEEQDHHIIHRPYFTADITVV